MSSSTGVCVAKPQAKEELTEVSPGLPACGGNYYSNIRISENAKVVVGNVINVTHGEPSTSGNVTKEAAHLLILMKELSVASESLCKLINYTGTLRDGIHRLVQDLRNSQAISNTIALMLSHRDSSEGVVWASMWDDLEKIVQSNLLLFEDIRSHIHALEAKRENETNSVKTKAAGKQASLPPLPATGMDILHQSLVSNNIAMETTVSMANRFISGVCASWAMESVSEHFANRSSIQTILCESRDLTRLPLSRPHTDVDRATVQEDRFLLLERFINADESDNDTVSLLSESTVRRTPSIQVSGYLDSLYLSSGQTWFTAPENTQIDCTQIFVVGLPTKRTMILHVSPIETIISVKSQICERLVLLAADFQLVYRGRILRNGNTLKHHQVFHNSTVFCIAFRLNGPNPIFRPERLDTYKFAFEIVPYRTKESPIVTSFDYPWMFVERFAIPESESLTRHLKSIFATEMMLDQDSELVDLWYDFGPFTSVTAWKILDSHREDRVVRLKATTRRKIQSMRYPQEKASKSLPSQLRQTGRYDLTSPLAHLAKCWALFRRYTR